MESVDWFFNADRLDAHEDSVSVKPEKYEPKDFQRRSADQKRQNQNGFRGIYP